MTGLVEIDDTALHVVRRGSGPPLLLLVGLGGRADFWAGTMDHLAGRFDCISFDHRKCGDSLPSDIRTTVAVMAADALALMDRLGIARADIIGHSLGGAIAQHIAVHAPQRVGRLVLSASWAGPHPAFLELFALRKQVLQNCGPAAYMLQGNLLGNPGWWAMEHHEAMQAGIAARLASFAGIETEMERMDAVTAHDLRDRVGDIAAETMIICARDDAITPLPLSHELARLIPGARLEVMAAGNHFAPVTVPQDYRPRLDAFLTA
ncbi:MAG: alpha/beta fold hydrolase [Polymorphobacter sp.]